MIKKKNILEKKLHDDALTISPKFKKSLKKQLFQGGTTPMAKKNQPLTFKQVFSQQAFATLGIVAAVALLGTAAYALDARSTSRARQTVIEDTVELPESLEGVLGVGEMQALALADAPDGTSIVSIEIENEHGVVLYKVKFSDGSYRLYDAKSGAAFVDNASDVETDESVPTGFVAGISLQQARNIASAQRPGKTITKIELETENGVVVYSVRFADDGRVDVNATDGSIVRVRGADGEKTRSSDDDSDDHGSDDDHDSDHDSDDEDDDHHEHEDDDDKSDNSGTGSHDSDDD